MWYKFSILFKDAADYKIISGPQTTADRFNVLIWNIIRQLVHKGIFKLPKPTQKACY